MSSAVVEYNEVAKSGSAPAISLEEGEEGFLIRLPADISFKNGSAIIENQDSILFLKRLALIIKTLPNDVEVQVRGFTDNVPPPRNSIYQDNWELSTARAVSVVKELIKIGVNPARLGAVGYSEYRPVTTNATPAGRAKNRRVDIYFFAKKKSVQKQTQKSLLDVK
jgi:chemotaxis protein MotB